MTRCCGTCAWSRIGDRLGYRDVECVAPMPPCVVQIRQVSPSEGEKCPLWGRKKKEKKA